MQLKNSVPEDDPILMGVSFGGMIAIEVAKCCQAATVIMISSAATRRQLPWWMKVSGWLGLNWLLPARPWKGLRWLEDYFLGVENEDDSLLVDDFREKVDARYVVPGGGHLMVYNRAAAVSGILTGIIDSL